MTENKLLAERIAALEATVAELRQRIEDLEYMNDEIMEEL